MWIVRKYLAYLVFDNEAMENENSYTIAFEPFSNKVQPAIFEDQRFSRNPYHAALKKAKELNKEAP